MTVELENHKGQSVGNNFAKVRLYNLITSLNARSPTRTTALHTPYILDKVITTKAGV